MNLLTIEHLTKSYTERLLFNDTAFSINEGEKVGLIGINGTGKSTLLRIAAGLEEPDGGTVVKGRSLYIRYLPQIPEFTPGDTILDSIVRDNKNEPHFSSVEELKASAKTMLNRLEIEDFDAKVETLSGGQRKRVALASVLLSTADLLILDEPTNHLDVASREWIEEAVESYEGNLLFVSHDRYFINRFATRIWMLENGQIIDFRGTFEEYRAAQERKRLQAALPVKAEPEKPKKEKPRRPGGTKELEKQVAAAERAVAKAEARQYELTLKAEEVASNYLELQKVYDEQKALEEEIAALYTKWETLAAELEEARG